MSKLKGKITQIIGPVVDLDFGEENALPAIGHALEIEKGTGEKIVLEVARHLEPGRVRAVSLSSTDGLGRGTEAHDTGDFIKVPVGPEVLGRIFNVTGETIDEIKAQNFKKFWPIKRAAPLLEDQSTRTEV